MKALIETKLQRRVPGQVGCIVVEVTRFSDGTTETGERLGFVWKGDSGLWYAHALAMTAADRDQRQTMLNDGFLDRANAVAAIAYAATIFDGEGEQS